MTRPRQASIVQLTASAMRVYGANNFPASVLSAVKHQTDASQQFTTGPTSRSAPRPPTWREITGLLTAADADIVFLSCASGSSRGTRGRHPG